MDSDDSLDPPILISEVLALLDLLQGDLMENGIAATMDTVCLDLGVGPQRVVGYLRILEQVQEAVVGDPIISRATDLFQASDIMKTSLATLVHAQAVENSKEIVSVSTVQAINNTLSALVKISKELEALLTPAYDRRSIGLLYKVIFDTLQSIDPILATGIKSRLVRCIKEATTVSNPLPSVVNFEA